jgi:hypothetical protein
MPIFMIAAASCKTGDRRRNTGRRAVADVHAAADPRDNRAGDAGSRFASVDTYQLPAPQSPAQ